MASSGTRSRAFVAILVLVTTPAVAQESASGALTLQTAVDRALSANPTIAAARLSGAVNEAGIHWRKNAQPRPDGRVRKGNAEAGLWVSLPIELGGKRAKRIAVGQATLHAGQAELAATIAQVRNDVRRAYFDVLVDDARLATLREQRDLSHRVKDTAASPFRLWRRPTPGSRAGGARAGRPKTRPLPPKDCRRRPAPSSTRCSVSRSAPRSHLPRPLEIGDPIVAETAANLARAPERRTRVLDRRIEEQRAKLVLARRLRMPDLVPTATLTHDAEPEFTWGWRAGIAVTLPLFTSHKAGVLVEQTTLDHLRRDAKPRYGSRKRRDRRGDRRRGTATGISAVSRPDPAAGATGRTAGAGLPIVSARPAARGIASGVASIARRAPAFSSTPTRNSRWRSRISNAPSELLYHDSLRCGAASILRGSRSTVTIVACGPARTKKSRLPCLSPSRLHRATRGAIRGIVHATGIVTPAPGAELMVVAPEAARIADLPHAGGDRVRRGRRPRPLRDSRRGGRTSRNSRLRSPAPVPLSITRRPLRRAPANSSTAAWPRVGK